METQTKPQFATREQFSQSTTFFHPELENGNHPVSCIIPSEDEILELVKDKDGGRRRNPHHRGWTED